MKNYVLPAEDLVLLNDLPPDHPKPIGREWINRGTDQTLRPSTVDQLLRTLYRPCPSSPSLARLHRTAGLRLIFRTSEDRARFGKAISSLRCYGRAE